MIITDQFIMLNFPKTGSSFSRKMIKKAYANAQTENTNLVCEELILPNIRNQIAQGKSDHHGTYSQIPEELRNRIVFSIIRNPLDRFLSLFAFGAWKQSPPIPLSEIRKQFPNFPNLEIDDFIRLQNQSIKYRVGFDIGKIEIGIQSIQLVQMFFEEPEVILKKLFTGSYSSKDEILSEIGNIKFLKQENLRDELISLLIGFGFAKSELQFIETEKASNITNYDGFSKSKLITDNLNSYLSEKEWLYNLLWEKITSHTYSNFKNNTL